MSTVKKPVPIAFCITELDPGGAERALVQLVTKLDRSEWEPRVFSLSGTGELAKTLEEAGISVICLNARSKFSPMTLFRLVKELRKFRPQILHSYLYHANIAGRLAGWWARVPVVISGIRVAEKRSRLPLLIDRLTQWFVDMNVCVSKGVAQFSINTAKLSPAKIKTISNGVEADLFANAKAADLSEFGIPTDSKTVIVVGRLDPQKNPMIMLEVAESLRKQHENLHYLFVGDGILKEELTDRIAQKKLGEIVHLAGQRDDIPQLLRASDCFVMPSLWEGMPNALLEAMASGLPIVTTAVEGTDELIEDGVTGYLVNSHLAEDFASKMCLILDELSRDSELLENMCIKSQRVVYKEFTWNRVVLDHVGLYRQLMQK